MSQGTHQVERLRTPSSVATTEGARPGRPVLSRLSVRELIAELAQVEESLHTGTALPPDHGARGTVTGRRELLRRANAIVGELAARRSRAGVAHPG